MRREFYRDDIMSFGTKVSLFLAVTGFAWLFYCQVFGAIPAYISSLTLLSVVLLVLLFRRNYYKEIERVVIDEAEGTVAVFARKSTKKAVIEKKISKLSTISGDSVLHLIFITRANFILKQRTYTIKKSNWKNSFTELVNFRAEVNIEKLTNKNSSTGFSELLADLFA